MRVLVTGANGMLATNVVEILLNMGYQVRGLLRRKESYKGVLNDSLELVEGDFTCLDTMDAALYGCHAVIHSAAITAQDLLRYEDYVLVNVDATAQLLTLAREHNIKKLLYVSSANTIGFRTTDLCDSPGSEDTPICKPLTNSLYGRSKAAAERLVVEWGGVVVNPTFMVGRYGSPEGSNQILTMARRITFCPAGGKSFIDVREAARGVVAALEQGKGGEKYLIAGDNMLFRDFFRLFPRVRYVVVVPSWIMLTAGFVGSVLRSLGVKTSLSLANVQILCAPLAYDGTKARRELNFVPSPIEQAIFCSEYGF